MLRIHHLVPLSSLAHGKRQAPTHRLVLVVVEREAGLQHPPQRIQPLQLPPLVDAHLAVAVDLDLHAAAAVDTARLLVYRSGVLGPASGLLDAVADVRKGRVQRLAILLGDAAAGGVGERVECVQELVLATVHGVALYHFAGGAGLVSVGVVVRDGLGVLVVFEGRVRLLVEEGDGLTGSALDAGVGRLELLDEGFHCGLGCVFEVVEGAGKEGPFFEGGDDDRTFVMRVDREAVRLNDVEEEGHGVFELLFGGAAEEGRGAQCVDGTDLDLYRLGVGDGAAEEVGGRVVDVVRIERDNGHSEGCFGVSYAAKRMSGGGEAYLSAR
jgi:hypothetical protein